MHQVEEPISRPQGTKTRPDQALPCPFDCSHEWKSSGMMMMKTDRLCVVCTCRL